MLHLFPGIIPQNTNITANNQASLALRPYLTYFYSPQTPSQLQLLPPQLAVQNHLPGTAAAMSPQNTSQKATNQSFGSGAKSAF